MVAVACIAAHLLAVEVNQHVAGLDGAGHSQLAVDVQVVVGRQLEHGGGGVDGDERLDGVLVAVREHVDLQALPLLVGNHAKRAAHLAVLARRGEHLVADSQLGHSLGRAISELDGGVGGEAEIDLVGFG